MTTRIGDETRARIAAAWPVLLDALETGVPFGPLLDQAGITRGQVAAYRMELAQADKEWATSREAGADAFADQVHQIANNPGADSNSARVRIQALQWLAAKRNPRVYSDKQTIDMNVRTVDLTAIIQAANARLAQARQPLTIEHEPELRLIPAHSGIADLM